jgi:TPR repeat protein
MEMGDEVNRPSTPVDTHSAPEKSDRSSSASSAATIATKDDEITLLKKAADQGHANAQFNLGVIPQYCLRNVDHEANIKHRAPVPIPVASVAGSAGASTSGTSASGSASQSMTTIPLQEPQIVLPSETNRR